MKKPVIIISVAFLVIAIGSLITGKIFFDFFSAQNSQKEEILNPKVLRVAAPTLLSERPFVGGEGRDIYGYPLKTADRIALLSLLRAQKFEELNKYLTAYHDDFDRDFRNEYWAYDSADAFNIADPDVGERIELWIRQTPDHFAPYLARARYFAARAWHARGGGLGNALSFSQSSISYAYFERASEDARLALEKRPRLLSAWRTLINGRMFAGDKIGLTKVYKKAERSCPQCWSLRFVRLISLQPKWSGDKQSFVAFAKETSSRKDINLRFVAAEAMIFWLLSQEVKGSAAEKKLTEGLEQAENFFLRAERAEVRNQLERFEEALSDTKIGLKSRPQSTSLLKAQANSLSQLRRVEESAPVLLTLGQINPAEKWLQTVIPWTVDVLLFEIEKEADNGNFGKTAVLCALAQDLGPYGKPYAVCNERLYRNIEARPALRAMVDQNPDDFVAHRHLDYALHAEQKTKDILPVWDDYLSRHPNDPRALFERAGTLNRLGRKKQAREGARKACDLGLANACKVLKR